MEKRKRVQIGGASLAARNPATHQRYRHSHYGSDKDTAAVSRQPKGLNFKQDPTTVDSGDKGQPPRKKFRYNGMDIRQGEAFYGNYRAYYGYRCEDPVKADPTLEPRVLAFPKEWFEGRDVLDVGCNTGCVTLGIAQLYSPSYILGVDIDQVLIQRATTRAEQLLTEIEESRATDQQAASVEAKEKHEVEQRDKAKDKEEHHKEGITEEEEEQVVEKNEDVESRLKMDQQTETRAGTTNNSASTDIAVAATTTSNTIDTKRMRIEFRHDNFVAYDSTIYTECFDTVLWYDNITLYM
eukprot:TRINITY_DN12770_c0_g1_i1.p1 TRINITY_DN12770_c0_g1~~TRINITY_DN12770_c0_g1_i1.p1  ORF type:complete len:296 (+),score=61.34 TRINITY_DN12770_c0_g1_i1:10-897(+)